MWRGPGGSQKKSRGLLRVNTEELTNPRREIGKRGVAQERMRGEEKKKWRKGLGANQDREKF